MKRYARHMALPDFGAFEQQSLKNAHILMIGAGGLSAAALPYLAGAGIGKITIYDDDTADISNLHRQTIYKTEQTGQNKAELAARYASSLNPSIKIKAISERFSINEIEKTNFDLIFDGSDNFQTKTMLNVLSIKTETPLISASVNQYSGQCGIFAGFAEDQPCYSCLFPELPKNARNCNEAGVLGTAAGITGLYQAHLTLLFLADLKKTVPGTFLSFDYAKQRLQKFTVSKNKNCTVCNHNGKKWTNKKDDKAMIDLISYEDLQNKNHIIVDVRTSEEIESDPIPNATHIEVSEIPARHEELPKDKMLAFVCAGNVRSVQAAEYLSALGYDNVIVLDKFSLPKAA